MIYEEYSQAQRTLDLYKSLPAVRIPDELTRPLGHGELKSNDLDFEMMINMRRKHQTKHAASGVRTKKVKVSHSTMRSHILQEFHQALKEAQDDHSAGTGVERVARWVGQNREPAPGGRGGVINGDKAPDLLAGNAGNAAVVATSTAREVCLLFSMFFNDCSYSHIITFRQKNDAKTFL